MIKPPPLPNYLSLEQVMPLMFVNAKCLNFDFDIIFLSGSIKNMFLFVMTNWSSFFFVYNPKKPPGVFSITLHEKYTSSCSAISSLTYDF